MEVEEIDDNLEICAVIIYCNDVVKETRHCEELKRLIALLVSGDLACEEVNSYKRYIKNIMVCEGVVKYKEIVIIPKNFRP